MNLFEIDKKIMECVDEETGEIVNEELLGQLQMDRDKKIENIACWIKNLKAEAEALKTEEDAFVARRKATENKVESLKSYLINYLNGEKFKSARAVISFRKMSSVNVTDASKLSSEYLRFKDPEPNKTAIKEAIKAGNTVVGAEIVEKQSILIK